MKQLIFFRQCGHLFTNEDKLYANCFLIFLHWLPICGHRSPPSVVLPNYPGTLRGLPAGLVQSQESINATISEYFFFDMYTPRMTFAYFWANQTIFFFLLPRISSSQVWDQVNIKHYIILYNGHYLFSNYLMGFVRRFPKWTHACNLERYHKSTDLLSFQCNFKPL